MELLVKNLAICFALIVIVWAIRYIRKHPEWLYMEDPYDQDPMILQMVDDHWDRREEINNATTNVELEAIYWDVEAFEATYRNLVPDEALIRYSNALYDAIADRRDKLGLFKKQVINM